MKTYLVSLLFFICVTGTYSQITTIPDSNFEQALINLGIDSDGTVNGQVLTTDISGLTTLDISSGIPGGNIQDLTGIEDFASLEILNISNSGVHGNDLTNKILDLTALQNLEEFYMNSGGDAITIHVQYLNLSNNPNLNIVQAMDVWSLFTINLKNSDLQLNGLQLSATNYEFVGQTNVCITVSNPTQAQNSQGIYATWNTCCHLTYSSDCNLRTTAFAKNNILLYPNPATELFNIESQQNIEMVNIYNLQGKLVKSHTEPQENYSVMDLAKGIYFIEIKSVENQKQLLKLVKK